MSDCPGVHCPGCDGGGFILVLGGLAAAGAVVWVVITFVWVIAAILGVTAAVSVATLVWLARYGADVATVQRSPLPAPEATPIPSRTAQALPAPQQLHIHFHGLDPVQAAEVVRRQAITDSRELARRKME